MPVLLSNFLYFIVDNISPRSAARRGRSSRRNKPEDTRESTPEESNNLTQINIKNEQFDDKIFHKVSKIKKMLEIYL